MHPYLSTCECSHQTHVGQPGHVNAPRYAQIYTFRVYSCSGLLVKPGTAERRNTGTALFRNTEHRNTKNF